MKKTTDRVRVAILGASGYTGGELVRLLANHANAEISVLTADRRAGEAFATAFLHLAGVPLPDMIRIEDAGFDAVDFVFCCLPHATTQEVIAGLPGHLKVVDLSADFRISDLATYEQWYGHPHQAPELQRQAVYGLTEFARSEIASARLVANPGCYPTASLLALVPLVEAGLIDADDVIIDAKSGMTGAGRALKEAMLYSEVAEGIHAYDVANHRHAPEIEQTLSRAAGRPIVVSFTPHLMPMNRGILATSYVRLVAGATPAALRETLAGRYEDEPFVRVAPAGVSPATRHVRGSNFCVVGVFPDRMEGRAILVSVTDNLVKGASGQAVQNMNVMCGFPEITALEQQPLFP